MVSLISRMKRLPTSCLIDVPCRPARRCLPAHFSRPARRCRDLARWVRARSAASSRLDCRSHDPPPAVIAPRVVISTVVKLHLHDRPFREQAGLAEAGRSCQQHQLTPACGSKAARCALGLLGPRHRHQLGAAATRLPSARPAESCAEPMAGPHWGWPGKRGSGTRSVPRPRIISDPPLLVPIDELLPVETDRTAFESQLKDMIAKNRRTLETNCRFLLEQFEFIDMGRKVVSVGTRCWIILMLGRDDLASAVPAGQGGRQVGPGRLRRRQQICNQASA